MAPSPLTCATASTASSTSSHPSPGVSRNEAVISRSSICDLALHCPAWHAAQTEGSGLAARTSHRFATRPVLTAHASRRPSALLSFSCPQTAQLIMTQRIADSILTTLSCLQRPLLVHPPTALAVAPPIRFSSLCLLCAGPWIPCA